jgi:hypothetical protein
MISTGIRHAEEAFEADCGNFVPVGGPYMVLGSGKRLCPPALVRQPRRAAGAAGGPVASAERGPVTVGDGEEDQIMMNLEDFQTGEVVIIDAPPGTYCGAHDAQSCGDRHDWDASVESTACPALAAA